MGIVGKDALVIDDDKSFRVLLGAILKGQGVAVSQAESLTEAWDLIHKKAPHFIFLDMELTGEKGLEFLEVKAARPELKSIPVFVVTSTRDPQSIRRAVALGAREYLLKPISSERLILKMRKVIQDGEFLTFDIAKRSVPVSLTLDATLVGAADDHLQISAPIKFAPASVIELSGMVSNALSLGKTELRTSAQDALFSGVGSYTADVEFVGATPETLARVKQCIHFWEEIESNHPRHAFKSKFPKVALIDDDPAFCKLAQKLVSKLGIQIECFSEPEPFLAYIKETPLSALLIDLHIGRARLGFNLVEAIRKVLGPYTPIYVLSSESRSEVVSEALELGCTAFVSKSQNIESLSTTLSAHLLPKPVDESSLKLFRTPKELAPVKVSLAAQLTGGDEVGLRFVSSHLPAKQANVVLESIVLGGETMTSRPITLSVSQNWVDPQGGGYGFYAESQDDPRFFSEVVRKVLAKSAI